MASNKQKKRLPYRSEFVALRDADKLDAILRYANVKAKDFVNAKGTNKRADMDTLVLIMNEKIPLKRAVGLFSYLLKFRIRDHALDFKEQGKRFELLLRRKDTKEFRETVRNYVADVVNGRGTPDALRSIIKTAKKYGLSKSAILAHMKYRVLALNRYKPTIFIPQILPATIAKKRTVVLGDEDGPVVTIRGTDANMRSQYRMRNNRFRY